MLADADARLEPDDAVAVSIGPGSFTGLRIALSFAKGLAFASGLRIVGVPTLDALALATRRWIGVLCTALDARKQEIYAALYEREGDAIVRRGSPVAVSAPRLAATLTTPCTVVGDAAEAYGDVFRRALGQGVTLVPAVPPLASAVARLATARLRADPRGDDPVALAPAYCRPAQAELKQSATMPSPPLLATDFVDKVPLVY